MLFSWVFFIINFSRIILLKLLFFYWYHQKIFIKMADVSDFKRGQIVGACMAGSSVTKTAELFSVAKSTVSKVMTAFEKEGKTSLLKQNPGRKRKLSVRDHRTLTWIVRKDHRNIAPNITAELNDHLEDPVSSKTVRKELHRTGFPGRAAIRKSYQNKLVWNFWRFLYFVQTFLYIHI